MARALERGSPLRAYQLSAQAVELEQSQDYIFPA